MDGTLLNDASVLTPRTIRALKSAMDKGVYVVLASGRMARAMRPYADQIGLNAPIIADNGALIYDLKTHKILHHRPLKARDGVAVLKACEQMGLYVQAYMGDDYYFEEETEYSREYARAVAVSGKRAGAKLSEFCARDALKLLIVDEPARIERIRPEFVRRFGDRLNIAVSRPHFLEFTHKSAEKGAALKTLAGLLGVDRREIAAFGDAQNDLSMLAYAGVGLAVNTARADVLAAADAIVPGNDEDGVARWIEGAIGV
jgi:Cof subfamily protein (haloacid dehalogenase superfamily)